MKKMKKNYVLAYVENEKIVYVSAMEQSGSISKRDTVTDKFISKKEASIYAKNNKLLNCWIESLTGQNRYNLVDLKKINLK
jgi:hypothetical protein